MSVIRRSTLFDSTASSQESHDQDDVNVVKQKNLAKDLLKSRIFLGRYLERRLINPRIGYRDVVVVSPAEVDLKRDLLEVQNSLRVVCPNIQWIGITDTEPLGYTSGVCVWTEIDNQPFGPFWFQVKSLKFREEEIIVTVKCLRHISDAFLELEPVLTGGPTGTSKSKEKIESKVEKPIEALSDTVQEIKANLKSALSITNVKEFFTFIFALVIAVFTGSTAFINFLGNFILALLRELSILVKNSTPMFLGFLDFLSKIVGGFYILLAMFFKPSNPPPQNKRSLRYHDKTPSRYNNDYDSRYID
ncbi:uncharacterized protein LOC125229779 [Leguminivora glycinivorella]|uniref:uncharacterized protein LOC125229779 n=1 Tax=Leguminivora glycinivorella TaxID=1035111 RepID=UPI00200F68D8|nr:uncharacterized protein LOC125229779 [Leguminivora glycinivorella]